MDIRDENLLKSFSKGNEMAAKELTHRHLGKIYNQAFRLTKNPHDAEEIAQEVFIRLWKIAPTWENRGAKLSSWLHRVTYNLCLDKIRNYKIESMPISSEIADHSLPAIESISHQEQANMILDVIKTMPPRQKEAIILKYLEEYSNSEIAYIMESSVEAVESLLGRGKKYLTIKLKGRG